MILPYMKGQTLIATNEIDIWDITCDNCKTLFTEQASEIPASEAYAIKFAKEHGWFIGEFSDYCPGC